MNHAAVIDRRVETTMRDGTILRGDVYRPAEEGAHPALVLRTPYNRADPTVHTVMFDVLRAVAAGYAVVVQDTRGRYESEGRFVPFQTEGPDGYDTIEWTAAQPWASGRIGMVGTSYSAYAQWLAAIESPPHLCAIAPRMAPDGAHTNWVYQGGAFQTGFNTSWVLGSLALDELARADRSDTDRVSARRTLTSTLDGIGDHFQERADIAHALGAAGVGAYHAGWREHPPWDPFWDQVSITGHRPNVTVPALSIGGWYDVFLQGTLTNFVDGRGRCGTPEARSGQRLLVGPWLHGFPHLANPVGNADFGFASLGAVIDVTGRTLRFLDEWVRGAPPAADARVTVFVMGANEWREFDDWPPAGAVPTPLYLHSTGHAGSSTGDGVLSREPPGNQPRDTFVYDPTAPVQTVGGGLCCSPVALRQGAFDQRGVETRSDVLVYTTPELEHSLTAVGPVTVELHAASSARDTDFTAKLVDVFPDGYARNVTDGILRVSSRGADGSAWLDPGRAERLVIDLAGTAHVFHAGHRIRLEVSSSNYPRFEPNPNTGDSPSPPVRAVQEILHDAGHASALLLSIIGDPST
jgi:putative CocE/NonD family hydrolase